MTDKLEVTREDIEAFNSLMLVMPGYNIAGNFDPQDGYQAFARYRIASVAAARPAHFAEAAGIAEAYEVQHELNEPIARAIRRNIAQAILAAGEAKGDA